MSKVVLTEEERDLKHHLIDKYREMIAERYDYDLIKNTHELPPGIDKGVSDALKNYFLNNLYPEPLQREKLDAAFDELESYVHQPAKVWGLLGNLTVAIFRFGRQFPAALRAGLISLEAHTAAKRFENNLLHSAQKRGFKVPLDNDQFLQCITDIPYIQIERFIYDIGQLFSSFANTVLLGKTISIMKDVLAEMKKKDHLYGPNEVAAIELGLDIMQKGYDLFEHYDEQLKKDMVAFITTNERQFVEGLYDKLEGLENN